MHTNLIELCRYYKGEEENPFETLDQNKAMFWFYERHWFLESTKQEPDFSDMLTEYLNNGLLNYSFNDGVPTTLKALLFNRYQHWNMAGSECFRQFYAEEYLGVKKK